MIRPSTLIVLLCAGIQYSSAVSGADAPQAGAPATSHEAAARYAADKKLCAEEATSGARMQCLRDAKAEYTKALAEARRHADTANAAASGPTGAACAECGKVLAVTVQEKKGEGGALGVIGGGVAGALLGHQVGGGSGKDLATIAGAAGGAYAGHKIEEKMSATKVWAVKVRLNGGKEQVFTFDHEPGFAVGDSIKLSGKSIVHR